MNMARGNKARIDSLQALRAIAFLGIFLFHTYFYVSWSELGVSIFLVMSGFLMEYNYENVIFDVSIKNNLLFSWSKIKKLYPLHIITMLVALCLSIIMAVYNGITLSSICILTIMVIANVFLVQTWIPNSNYCFSLNGASWYLSVMLFMYFLYPWMHKMINKCSVIKLCCFEGAILALELIVCIPFGAWVGTPVYIWFMYCFPLFRIGDFFLGCILKRIVFESGIRNISAKNSTFLEMVAVLGTIFIEHFLSFLHMSDVSIPLRVSIVLVAFLISTGLSLVYKRFHSKYINRKSNIDSSRY